MVTQQEAIELVASGSAAEEVRNPSGMRVVDPNNISAQTVVLSLMRSYRYENNRRRPPAVLVIRKPDGMVLINDNFQTLHYSHRRKAKRSLRGYNYASISQKLLYDESGGYIVDNAGDPYVFAR